MLLRHFITIYSSLSRVSQEFLETARCCSDRAFYNICLTFTGLGGASRDRSMMLRPCILQYIMNLSQISEELLETAQCCSDRTFYSIFLLASAAWPSEGARNTVRSHIDNTCAERHGHNESGARSMRTPLSTGPAASQSLARPVRAKPDR